MAIAKVADRYTATDNAVLTTVDLVFGVGTLTVGNHLIIRVAADNSGGGGAARTVTVTNQSGTPIDVATDQQFQRNYDPGAASAGATATLIIAEITATSGTVRLTFSGSVIVACIAEEWSGIDTTAPVRVSGLGATGTSTTPTVGSITGHAAGDLLYCMAAIEGPHADSYTEDSDTLEGSWVSLSRVGSTIATATDNMKVVGGYKLATGTSTQTWTPTITNRDWASYGIVLAAAPDAVNYSQTVPEALGLVDTSLGWSLGATRDLTADTFGLADGITVDHVIGVEQTITDALGLTDWQGVVASGGTVTTPGDGYKYHTFTADGTLNITKGGLVEYLVVAGGGAGGGPDDASGGGGAGGVLIGSAVFAASSKAITVGAGGAATSGYVNGNNGSNSLLGSIVASGGGGGGTGRGSAVGSTGGSGGGSTRTLAGGAGVTDQGNDGGTGLATGWAAGGGGGAGAVGGDGTTSPNIGGAGGAGIEWPVGSGDFYGGGGGGCGTDSGGTGGSGGGGAGGGYTQSGVAATANTGGGGGGAWQPGSGGAGGSGIVIARYLIEPGNVEVDHLDATPGYQIGYTGGYGWRDLASTFGDAVTLRDSDWVHEVLIVEDTFTAANNTAISGRTPDSVNTPGNTWSLVGTPFAANIQNNKASLNGDGGGGSIRYDAEAVSAAVEYLNMVPGYGTGSDEDAFLTLFHNGTTCVRVRLSITGSITTMHLTGDGGTYSNQHLTGSPFTVSWIANTSTAVDIRVETDGATYIRCLWRTPGATTWILLWESTDATKIAYYAGQAAATGYGYGTFRGYGTVDTFRVLTRTPYQPFGAQVGSSREVTDTDGLADLVTWDHQGGAQTVDRSATDDAGVSDAATTTSESSRSATDAAGVTDAALLASGHDRPVTDAEGAVDAASASMVTDKAVTDAEGLVDAATQVSAAVRTSTDAEGLTDTATRAVAADRPVTDAEGLVDAATRETAAARSVTDAEGAADAATYLQSLLTERSATDAEGLTDAATRAVAADRPVTDAEGLTDAATRAVAADRPVTDAEGIADGATSLQTILTEKAVTDAEGLTDAATPTQGTIRLLGDAIGLTDATIPVVAYTRATTDLLGALDAAGRLIVVARSLDDVEGLIDSASTAAQFLVVLTDDPGLSDTATFEYVPDPTAATMVKMWDGAQWVEGPLKMWDGASWVATRIRMWDGNAWVSL